MSAEAPRTASSRTPAVPPEPKGAPAPEVEPPAAEATSGREAPPRPRSTPAPAVPPRPAPASDPVPPQGIARRPAPALDPVPGREAPPRPAPALDPVPPQGIARRPLPPPLPHPPGPAPVRSTPQAPPGAARTQPGPLRPPMPAPAEPWHRSAHASAPPVQPYPPYTGHPESDRLPPTGTKPWTRPPVRAAAAVACLVLGLGLLGGAAAGSRLSGGQDRRGSGISFQTARELWHSVPVDEVFPRTLHAEAAGPGGAARTWTRIAVAPDSGCADAFDPLLVKALSPVGCKRLLRATYVDATTSSVTTVGLLTTRADARGMRRLHDRFAAERLTRRRDLLPRPYAAKGTAAASFGNAQRATWTVRVLTDAPVVVFAVTGFADGRTVRRPEPAGAAIASEATSAPVQAGLSRDAGGIADAIERAFRRVAIPAAKGTS